MNKKKTILLVSFALTFSLAIAGVIIVDVVSNKPSAPTGKSPYQLYCESHPNYNKNEEEWLQDLINGKLGDKQKYEVTFNSNGGSQVSKQTVLENEYIVKPENPTRLGYNFKEWLYGVTTWLFDIFTVSKNITLTANWNIIHYSIDYDLDGGVIVTDNPSSYTVESAFEFASPTKSGYEFIGWYDQNNTKVNSIVKGMTGDLSLTAKWSANKNNLSISSIDINKGSAQIVSGVGYTDENIVVRATPNSPFVFKGWYSESGLVSKENPYSFVMPAESVSLEAVFDELRHLDLSVSDSSKGVVNGAGDYVIGDKVTIECQILDGLFKGWYDSNNELVSSFTQYTFEMPNENYSLTAVFVNDAEEEEYQYKIEHGVIPCFSEDKKTVTYGMYPKNVVEDVELIAQLNQLDNPDEYGYYELDGDYYVRKNVKIFNFAKYYDIDDIDVPMNYESGTKMIDGSSMWFKAEPIIWDVVSANGDTYSLISNDLIESNVFHASSTSRIIDGQKVYAYNYEYSAVRKWLNGDFLNKVFALGKDYITETEVDNSDASSVTGNPHICNNTVDKLFLPSIKDIKTLPDYISSICKTTDYLRASGVFYDFQDHPYFGEYWTRSADSDIEYNDHVNRITSTGRVGRCSATITHCIRPCLTIEFK